MAGLFIIGLDEYLWKLSRTPQLPDPVVKQLLEKARGLVFKTDALVFVKQQ